MQHTFKAPNPRSDDVDGTNDGTRAGFPLMLQFGFADKQLRRCCKIYPSSKLGPDEFQDVKNCSDKKIWHARVGCR